MSEKSKNIWIISAGVGSEDFLTYRAVKVASEMDVLAGDSRFKPLFRHPRYITIKKFFEDVDNVVKDRSSRIGIVVSGDAGFFSLARYLYDKYGDRIVEVVPGISSFQAAASKLLETYENARFVSFHGNMNEEFELGEKTFILCGKNKPSDVLRFLKESIVDYEIFVCYNLGMKEECVIKVEDCKNLPDNGLAIIVLVKKKNG